MGSDRHVFFVIVVINVVVTAVDVVLLLSLLLLLTEVENGCDKYCCWNVDRCVDDCSL